MDLLAVVQDVVAATIPDGRTLLVTATPRGAVRLWDPDTGECVGRLNPYGSPIRSIAAVPIAAGHTLIAASDTAGRLQVWDPAVDDPGEPGAAVQLSARALADALHRVAAVAAVPTPDRTVLATGDDRGVVVLWDLATGAPIGDGLPASTGTAGLPVITATTPQGGRTILVTGTHHGHRLRVWEPETGTVEHIALDAALTCLATAGPDLIVGHDRGVLSLPLTRQRTRSAATPLLPAPARAPRPTPVVLVGLGAQHGGPTVLTARPGTRPRAAAAGGHGTPVRLSVDRVAGRACVQRLWTRVLGSS
ncbi:WD40 repeat domain-containing protein [Kitasatospora sp. McL0602]|uniref:WD40 repeat domain-containing protein n=1 Tax=Kitasatospora sp. McL0602 TaxID=3439530 RepID=UPI003F8A27F3